MSEYKSFKNGVLVNMTQEEITELQNIRALTPSEFDIAMEKLRAKRDKLLTDTDYLALSDQTLSTEMSTYRQALRDITNGLTTVEEVNSVTFPTKP